MYEAIVFLPLLGAVIAGAIALVGASHRHPGASPPPPDDDHAAPLVPDAHAHGAPRPRAAPSEIGHPSPEEEIAEPRVGSQAAELITTTLLAISWVLSCFAFVDVG
ncbi:MAG: NADH-quinone oxidoreductase subunit L, partial [Xanthobacteraceae bacterium]